MYQCMSNQKLITTPQTSLFRIQHSQRRIKKHVTFKQAHDTQILKITARIPFQHIKHHSLITKAKTYIQEALSIDHLHTKYNRAQWQTVIPTKRTFHTTKKTKSKCWLLRSLLWSPGKLVIQFRDAEGILLYCSSLHAFKMAAFFDVFELD